MKSQFWQGKRVLITGHTGFKGAWLSLWLQRLGARLTGYSLPAPTEPNLFEDARVAEGMETVEGDVRDFEHLEKVVVGCRPELVFHLAAQSLVRRSYAAPVETYGVNVMGTVHLLEAARRAGGVKSVVIVTSDKCYENREWFWGYRENDPIGGHDPYSSSKACAELVTTAYRRSFFNPAGAAPQWSGIASARAGNVIGGGDWAEDRIVPDFARAVLGGRAVEIRNPTAIRPWQHVLDPLAGYLLLAERLCGPDGGRYAESWNFGPGDEDAKPVSWMVERLTRLWGEGSGWQQDARDNPHEAHYLKLDCSKARDKLGWRPRWAVEKALEETVNWYRAYRSGGDMRRVTVEQINSYEGNLRTEVVPGS